MWGMYIWVCMDSLVSKKVFITYTFFIVQTKCNSPGVIFASDEFLVFFSNHDLTCNLIWEHQTEGFLGCEIWDRRTTVRNSFGP